MRHLIAYLISKLELDIPNLIPNINKLESFEIKRQTVRIDPDLFRHLSPYDDGYCPGDFEPDWQLIKALGINGEALYSFSFTTIFNQIYNDLISSYNDELPPTEWNDLIESIIEIYNNLYSDIVFIRPGWYSFKRRPIIGYSTKRFTSFTRLNTFDKEFYYQFLKSFKSDLKNEIKRLKSLIKIEDIHIDKDDNNSREFTPQKRYKSFSIISVDVHSEAFVNFYELLLDDNYIDCNDIRHFKRIFSNTEADPKIKWIGPKNGYKGALYYFINELMNRNIVKAIKEKWQVTCNCFTYADGEPIKPEVIARQKAPVTVKTLQNLNSILDILAS